LIVTVPEPFDPPPIEVGVSVRALTERALTFSVADLLVEFEVAVMVAVNEVRVEIVATEKETLVCPAETTTDPLAGTVTPSDTLSDETGTVRPPVGAALLIVSVAVDALPPVTLVGSMVRVATVGAVTARVAVWLAPLREPVMVDV
jgi:hypothetical protein